MTARAVKTAEEGGSNGDGLRGSPQHALIQGILGDFMPPNRPASSSIGQESHLTIPRSVIEYPEGPTVVVGHSPSGKSRLKCFEYGEEPCRVPSIVTLNCCKAS